MVKGDKTVDELLREQAADPEYQARMEARLAQARATAETLRKEQAPIVADLGAVGVTVVDLSELVSRSDPYPRGIPVLLDHLQRDYSPRTRQAIARALAVPDSNPYWNELLRIFLEEPAGGPNDVRFALGAALWGAAKPGQFSAIRNLLGQRDLGNARLPLVRAALEIGGADGEDLVRTLVTDEHLGREARKLLKQKGMGSLRRYGPKT